MSQFSCFRNFDSKKLCMGAEEEQERTNIDSSNSDVSINTCKGLGNIIFSCFSFCYRCCRFTVVFGWNTTNITDAVACGSRMIVYICLLSFVSLYLSALVTLNLKVCRRNVAYLSSCLQWMELLLKHLKQYKFKLAFILC